MELDKNDAAVCADSTEDEARPDSAAETDLYDELIAFAELSSEHSRLEERRDKPSAEPDERSADLADEQPPPEPVLLHATIESETVVEEIAPPASNEAEQPTSPEELAPVVWVEPVESATAAGESSPPSDEAAGEPHEPILIHAQIETAQSEPVEETQTPSADEAVENTTPELVATPTTSEPVEETQTPSEDEAVEDTTPELVVTPTPAEPVDETQMPPADEAVENTTPELVATPTQIEPPEPVTIVAAPEQASDSEVSKAPGETSDIRTPLVAGPRPSGPLSGFNLPPEIVYMGTLSRGVCLACGAESGTDDLFCLTCGVFIDEIASTLPSDPTCGECKQRIETGEIFCPWCGSAVPA